MPTRSFGVISQFRSSKRMRGPKRFPASESWIIGILRGYYRELYRSPKFVIARRGGPYRQNEHEAELQPRSTRVGFVGDDSGADGVRRTEVRGRIDPAFSSAAADRGRRRCAV